jgi:hypothetical protein
MDRVSNPVSGAFWRSLLPMSYCASLRLQLDDKKRTSIIAIHALYIFTLTYTSKSISVLCASPLPFSSPLSRQVQAPLLK